MPQRGPQPGDLVDDKYRLDLMIGTGGMGAVWSAAVVGSDTDRVAVKFLHSQLASDPLMVQRFLLEARAGLEIRHPNVVRVIAQGRLEPTSLHDDPTPWLVMELLTGKSLGDALRLRGRLEAADALAIMTEVAAGAGAAHACGIVHRDLKPANVFLQQTNGHVTPKVLDFGISKYVDPSMDGGLTSTGAIVGSAMYMSPEQAAGGYNVDARTDVWALGVMLYRMLTGESPVPASGRPDMLVALTTPHELDLSALKHPRIAPAAADIVRRCLRKKREERWPSARELESELRAALAAETRQPDIDALLRPASSRATFIAAPLDSTPEPTAATAPTGHVRGDLRPTVRDDEALAAETLPPIATGFSPIPGRAPAMARGPMGPTPSMRPGISPSMLPGFVGPPAPRSDPSLGPGFLGPPTPRGEVLAFAAPKSTLEMPGAPYAAPRGTSTWAKAGAIAIGLAAAAVIGVAWRHRPAGPAAGQDSPAVTSQTVTAARSPGGPAAPSDPGPRTALAPSEPEPESSAIELGASPPASSADEASPPTRGAGTRPRRRVPTARPPATVAPAPSAPAAEPWRRPGF